MMEGQGVNHVQMMTSQNKCNNLNQRQKQRHPSQQSTSSPLKRTLHIWQRSSDISESLRAGALEAAVKKAMVRQYQCYGFLREEGGTYPSWLIMDQP